MPGALEPRAQPVEVVDGEACVVRAGVDVARHQVHLEIAAAAVEPDEPPRFELRRHVDLVQSEHAVVERAHLVVGARREAERDVLEPHRPERWRRRRETVSTVTAASRISPVTRYWTPAEYPSSPIPFATLAITRPPKIAFFGWP